MNDNNHLGVKVEQVRPSHLLEMQADFIAADIAWLAGRKSMFVETACPVCANQSATGVFAKNELDYLSCPECGTVFVSPRPTEAILEQYYITSRHYAFWNKHIWPYTAEVRREKVFRPRVNRVIELCRQYSLSRTRLLEIGPGYGFFGEEAKQSGFFEQIVVVEPNPGLAESCRNKGLQVIEGVFEKAQLTEGAYDIIACFEVIEHLFDPRAFLRKCFSVMNDNGLMVLTCPNVDGFEIAVLQEKADSVEQEHLNLFNPASVKRLLSETGFEIVEITTPGQLDGQIVRNKIIEKTYDVKTDCFLKQMLIDKWDEVGEAFQKFLADNKLSSHMWVVAHKPESEG